ncbi:tRNA(Ile)-lysidine synthase [Agrobacterium vitis]|nr:tRNA(Ile)-lysidine synthase [Agrobacterium vitis]MBE1436891.1 tRNA(Ile)-lysidine synthase [Agrobacterium vitis]
MMTTASSERLDTLNTALHRFLQKRPRPCRLLVAVSGGSDSKGLLIALHELLHGTSAYPVTLAAATIDHGLRPESAQEAQEVAALCSDLGIEHVIRHWNGPKPATGISAAAREARYHLLAEAAAALGADVIVTGHTADDQAETIAMRKQRNDTDNALGLSGMADHVLYRNHIWIHRPLLTCRREEIRGFLSARGQSWLEDPSNSNPRSERARVRAALLHPSLSLPSLSLPSLSQATCPALPSPQQRLDLSTQAADLIRTHVTRPATGVIAVETDAFSTAKAGLRHALQALVTSLGGQSHGPSQQALNRLLALLDQPCGARLTLGRCLAHRHKQGLLLVREARGYPTLTVAPGTHAIWDGRWQIANDGTTDVRVTPTEPAAGDAAQTAAVIPVSIAALGRQSMPQLHTDHEDAARHISADGPCQPIISQYFTFLPAFDWPLATALADVLGAKPFFPADF